jgi:putative transcriptional regulator
VGDGFTSLQGQLLIASPALVDPNFWRTVVVVTEHTEEGAMGLVLNRPLELTAAEAVEPGAVIALAEFEDAALAASLAFEDVGFVGSDPDVPALGDATRRVRIFAGYSGWGPGQLEGELAEEAWLLESARADDVFTVDPSGLWSAVLRRKGGIGAMLSLIPPDPRVN